jgi:ribonuclease HI
MEFPCDFLTEFLPVERNFEVSIRTREDWNKNGMLNRDNQDWTSFTDGSRTGNSSGAAYFIEQLPTEEESKCIIPLGRYMTVYQSEVMALVELGRYLKECCPSNITTRVYVDSQAALKSLCSEYKVVGLARETFNILNELGRDRTLILDWIPAHTGYDGNEVVDGLAKQAAEMRPVGPEPIMSVSLSVVKLAIRDWARKNHISDWRQLTTCRQTKIFAREPYSGNLKGIIKLSRKNLRLLVQTITGHNTLNSHLKVIGLASSPVCSCGQGKETGLHFLGVCEMYAALRQRLLGSQLLTPDDLSTTPLTVLAEFIAKSGRYACNHESGSEQ